MEYGVTWCVMSRIRTSGAIPNITALQMATASLAVPKSVMNTSTGRAPARCPAAEEPVAVGSVLEQPIASIDAKDSARTRKLCVTLGRQDLIKDISISGIPQRPETFRTHSFYWSWEGRVPRTLQPISRTRNARPRLTPLRKIVYGIAQTAGQHSFPHERIAAPFYFY